MNIEVIGLLGTLERRFFLENLRSTASDNSVREGKLSNGKATGSRVCRNYSTYL
jgi:hypothetical protein